ncbi:MAG: hypothetical protein CL696_10590 [Chloroflexi bacterium]|jgi:quercetin dioxygenase-like cupin family protein|nr:hypothetical protein [Chloroflexota bacterium]MDP6498409.1 cupin domain-containing protein [Dehalococcoidia bacterium]MQG10868.1 cupin domain-containing protein [SAR202 cluster bacterium]MQG55049.1 cupin domain-containing protein [SAR202 cluster bacterium]|tara:strand:- start:4919 stop:5950 length:1032 start_codon:yes stop_codon:yes gene_type:complete
MSVQGLDPDELAAQRDEILNHFSRIDSEFDRRRGENRLLVKGDDIEWESASRVHPTQQEGHLLARIISPELGFNIHTFRVFKRQIGGGGIDGAFHTHGDAVKYYLEGKGKEIIDDQEVEVSPGDLAFIPANIWHGTENTGDEPMVFIAFHQIPGTHLPVPASWQYHADDLTEHESIESLIAKMENEDPAAMDSATLYSWRQHLLHELGVLDDEFNNRRKSKNYLVSRDEIPWKTLADSQSVTLIAPELGFDIHTLQLSMRVVPPGHTDSTFHRHGEAVHYYLSGQGHQIVGEESIAVETGDLVFIPAGIAHGIKNSADAPMRVLVAEQLPGTYLQRPVIKGDS